MNQSAWSIFVGLTVAVTLTLVIQPFVTAQPVTNDDNKNSSQDDKFQYTNNTRAIINTKNHTITLIDTRTNETISVKNFTLSPGNIITNESKSTKNATQNVENATENINLTEKFNALSK